MEERTYYLNCGNFKCFSDITKKIDCLRCDEGDVDIYCPRCDSKYKIESMMKRVDCTCGVVMFPCYTIYRMREESVKDE